jgi:hypothetical protein
MVVAGPGVYPVHPATEIDLMPPGVFPGVTINVAFAGLSKTADASTVATKTDAATL